MSSIQQLPKPEQLVDLVSHAAAVKLAMDGEFDKKIDELKAATQALANAQTIAATVEEAEKLKADAEFYDRQVREDADRLMEKAVQAVDAAKSREITVASREQAVSSREAAAESRQATQDRREQAILEAQDARETKLTLREKAVQNAEADLAAKAKKLASDQAAFNQKLEALRA